MIEELLWGGSGGGAPAVSLHQGTAAALRRPTGFPGRSVRVLLPGTRVPPYGWRRSRRRHLQCGEKHHIYYHKF